LYGLAATGKPPPQLSAVTRMHDPTHDVPALPPALLTIAGHSPFLARLAGMRALHSFDWKTALSRPSDPAALGGEVDAALAAGQPLDQALRDLRARTLAHLLIRDAAGVALLEEVVSTLSSLATVAVQHAERASRAEL